MNKQINRLTQEFKTIFGVSEVTLTPLPPSGSNRLYYRLQSGKHRAIGTVNDDHRENRAFIYLSEHLRKYNIPVPAIFFYDQQEGIYLQEDLGDTRLFHLISEPLTNDCLGQYKSALQILVDIQQNALGNLNFSHCYPRSAFDMRSMQWDLNYFKYMFLKLAGIPFDEELLENDFQRLNQWLQQAPGHFFMHRDFKSQNIMVHHKQPYLIDYQGGRQGPLQYDLASLLFEAKAGLSPDTRLEILEHYTTELEKHQLITRQEFLDTYYGFVLLRLLQAFGTYGYRGFFEGKQLFLESIDRGLQNIRWLLSNGLIPPELGHLIRCLEQMVDAPQLMRLKPFTPDSFTVTINSFSYRKGYPYDNTGNGGGHVFDCRVLPNPGRYDEYKMLTGKDEKVIRFLQSEAAVDEFIGDVCKIIERSVTEYQKAGYRHLQVNFGCTGGQHRSVYCAEATALRIKQLMNIPVILVHREQEQYGRKTL